MDDGFDWGMEIDKGSIKNPKGTERKLVAQLKTDLPHMSNDSWDAVFQLVRAERRRRLGNKEN